MSNVGKVFNLSGGGGSGSPKMESLTIATPPNKTVYKSGETFDPTGMVVVANYGEGLMANVTGYTVSPSVLTDGVSEVVITYTEGRITKTATVAVTVKKVLVSIAITMQPAKTVYQYQESLDPTGMVVTATFSDGSTADVLDYTYPTTNFSTLGRQVMKLEYTYEGVTKSTDLVVTVQGKTIAVPTQTNIPTYNGSDKTPSWNGYDPLKMEISGVTSASDAGSYTAIFKLSYGYLFPDGTDEARVKWTIDRAVISALPTQTGTLVADGTSKTPSWSGYDTEKMTIGGDTSGTNAGDYTATFTPTSNYKWSDGSTGAKEVKWTIISVLVSIPSQSGTLTYNGSAQTPKWQNFDNENSSVSVSAKTNAGEYTATFTLKKGMWTDGTTAAKTIKWTIGRATIAAVPAQSGTLVYDGNPKTPSWNTAYDSAKMTVSVTAATNAGTYSATFTPTSNYKWSDGSTGGKTASWTIGKAANSVTNSPSSIVLKSSAKTATFTVNRKGNGTITATSNNTSVAKIKSINQSTGVVTVESVNDTTGTAKITVKVAEGTNYKAASDTTVSVTATFREYLYGFDLTIADSNPATRVTYPSDVENSWFAKAVMNFGGAFSYGSWPSTPGEKFMPRPCMLRFNGTVDYYLNPNDYTKKADGTTSDVANMNYGGNAMMEWPKIYVKRWESNGVYHFRCSDMKVDSDYECWSNYDKNNKEIPHFYTPIFFGSKDGSNRLRSISGQSNFVRNTAQTEVTYAKNNGADIWYTEVLSDRELVNDLLTMMFKSTDLQATAGYGVCSASAAIAPGSMNTKGLFWGAGDKTSGVKVFGMENWWGNIFRRIAGWCISGGTQKVKLTRGTKDGTTVGDYNFDGNGYKTISGVNLTRSGYISKMKTEPFGRFPMEANGSTTTFEADQVWADSGNGYYACVGGGWDIDLGCGPFGAGLYVGPSVAGTGVGAALSCKPLAAA
jgi:hypothetical protein